MRTEFKLLIVCIVAVCFTAAGLNALAADLNGPQQSITTSTPPIEVEIGDISKKLCGAPPTSPVVIAGTPDYLWRHGCGPTAVGNVIGYYDCHGYYDLIVGDANVQTDDVNQAMASGGDSTNPNPAGSEKHYEDYARPEDAFPTLLTDDYLIPPGRPAHTNDCIGDYQDTSKSTRNNYYGWSWSTDIGPSFVNYVNQQNATYNPSYIEYSPVTGKALTWAVLTNEINNNRPMVFLVDTDGDNQTDHFVAVVGYDAPTNQYGCRDSWAPQGDIRWETFQGIGSYQPWSIWGGWSFQLGQATEVTKYQQLPDMTYYGMDIRCDRKGTPKRVLADDFPCTMTGPITKVRLWGSWKGDVKGTINKIHLSIHSDDPAGPGGTDPYNTYSKPDQLLWHGDFDSSDFIETIYYQATSPYEWWWDPNTAPIANNDRTIWQYEIRIDPLDPCGAFIQQGTPTNQIIYWLDAYADINSTPSTANFGWKTAEMHWNDDAVRSIHDGSPWMELRYPSPHPRQGDSIDLSFAIITGHTESNEVNYPTNAKWLQKPDLSPNGVDVAAIQPYPLLADDFECNKSTLITDITVWGSWRNDYLPPGGASDVQFTLSVHSDITASQNPSGYSMPNEVLWYRTLRPSEVIIQRQDINEGWWHPYYQEYLPIGDHVCWKYVFHIPEANAFCQKGTLEHPIIYWLDVQAQPNDISGYAQFGWKSSINHWNDDAVWTSTPEPFVGPWNELVYPTGHPLAGQSIDLAFAIDGNIPCNLAEHELGDAPDSTNNSGLAMTAYPATAVLANYPTVCLDPTGLPPFGPIHLQPLAVAYLGQNVTLENEADIGPDQDPTNNIIPATDTPDQDLADDGVLNMPISLPKCLQTTFQYQINVVNPTIDLYVNVWFDWNRDGDWDDTPSCGSGMSAPEWAVQNQFFPAGLPVGLNTVTSLPFVPWHPTLTKQNIWMRITLSEQPWVGTGSGGSGPAAGYYFGETEDYFFEPDPNCLYVGRVFNLNICNPPLAGNIIVTQVMVNMWNAVGKPQCWCCDAQKCGNGIYVPAVTLNKVDGFDLAQVKKSFGKNYLQAGYIACVDFNISGKVDGLDLAVLKKHFGKIVGSAGCQ